MMQSAVGYHAGAPAIHGGGWGFDKTRQFSDASKVIDNFLAKTFHSPTVAIIATRSLAKSSDLQDCDNRVSEYADLMDVDQLKRLMAEQGESQVGLVRLMEHLGMTRDKFSKTLKGKRRFTVEEMDILRRYFLGEQADDGPHMLPIVGLVNAGEWKEGFEEVRGYIPSPERGLSRQAFVVIIEGDSMDKVAKPGEQIIIDPTDLQLVSGKYYIIRNDEGESTFKRYEDGPARLEPCSSNPKHTTIYPGQHEFKIIGRVRKKVVDL